MEIYIRVPYEDGEMGGAVGDITGVGNTNDAVFLSIVLSCPSQRSKMRDFSVVPLRHLGVMRVINVICE